MLEDLKTLPAWHEFCKRYRYDITRFAVEVLNMTEEAGQAVTPQQEMLFTSIQVPGSRTTVASGHGCFGIDTPIMCYDGTIKVVQDITLDDVLMGDDGTPRNVLDLCRGRENMYRFTYNDGTSHVFNESHILCLVATNSKGTRKTGDKNTVTVKEYLTWGSDKKRCHAVYRNSVDDFGGIQQSLPIDPYIFGTWLGDGSSRGTEITTADDEIKQAWQDYANQLGCRFVERAKIGKATTYAISKASPSNHCKNLFYHALNDLGVWQNKHIPQIYLTADLESRKQLLAGLIDTDGSRDKNGYDFVQKNKTIAYQVVFLAKSIGCHATVKKITKVCGNNGAVGTYYRLTIGRNIDLIPVRIERKKRLDTPHQRRNLNFGIKSVEPLGMGDYYGFVLDGNHQFLGGDFTVLHNTGKSRSAGIIALWHLLCFDDSIMMFTAPQIGQLRTVVWKEISICLERLRNGVWGWLANYVAVFSEKVYIKGYEKTWFVFAKTAPKHQPTNIAGQHGDNYMVWADEACGIDDAVMEVAIGALTHKDNRAVLTSQPARGTGFFYDTHHKLSHKNGGKWIALKFNGELSPIVSRDKLIEALYQYGDRNSPGYLVRIRGEFPELKGEFLITRSEFQQMLAIKQCINSDERFGYIITVDVGGGVGRDSSVITLAKIVDKVVKGRVERFVEVLDIPLVSSQAQINQLKAKIYDLLDSYPGAMLVIDPIGSGAGLCQTLKAEGIYFSEVHWGVNCFKNANRLYYLNKRSHAYVSLAKAIQQGRFCLSQKVQSHYGIKNQIEEQAIKLPYVFDEKARWKMLSKEDMRKQGISSPDILDTFAFCFLEYVNYAPADSDMIDTKQKDSQEWDVLKAFAHDI